MSDKQVNGMNKLILKGRIYPGILSCVNNRWRIFIGIFAYYSLQFTSYFNDGNKSISEINLLISWLFTGFILHNLFNYTANLKVERLLEEKRDINWWVALYESYMEWTFTLLSINIVWLLYHNLK